MLNCTTENDHIKKVINIENSCVKQNSTLTYVRECTGGDFVILTYYHLKSAVPFVPVANRNCK